MIKSFVIHMMILSNLFASGLVYEGKPTVNFYENNGLMWLIDRDYTQEADRIDSVISYLNRGIRKDIDSKYKDYSNYVNGQKRYIYNNWRLPTKEELLSIGDKKEIFYDAINNAIYTTSTTITHEDSACMGGGYFQEQVGVRLLNVFGTSTGEKYYIRLVRDVEHNTTQTDSKTEFPFGLEYCINGKIDFPENGVNYLKDIKITDLYTREDILKEQSSINFFYQTNTQFPEYSCLFADIEETDINGSRSVVTIKGLPSYRGDDTIRHKILSKNLKSIKISLYNIATPELKTEASAEVITIPKNSTFNLENQDKNGEHLFNPIQYSGNIIAADTSYEDGTLCHIRLDLFDLNKKLLIRDEKPSYVKDKKISALFNAYKLLEKINIAEGKFIFESSVNCEDAKGSAP